MINEEKPIKETHFIAPQKALHKKFGFEARKSPGMLPEEVMKMRLNFLLEEVNELAQACGYGTEITEEYDIKVKKDPMMKINPEQILDALIDIQVVLLGTAHLMGFFNSLKVSDHSYLLDTDYSIFEEAYVRVWMANMKKERCQSNKDSKRNCSYDLKKPVGWKPPYLKDLVEEFHYGE